MRPEDIDDLFKGKLEDHSSSLPSPLWSRLEERMQQQKPEHSVDGLFKTKLENHATPLPADLWNRIEERMNPEQKKVRPLWTWYAAACIALLLSVVGFWRMDKGNNTGLVAVETTKDTNSDNQNTTTITENSLTETLTSENSALPDANPVSAASTDNVSENQNLEKAVKVEAGKSENEKASEISAPKAQKMPAAAREMVKEEKLFAVNQQPAEVKNAVVTPENPVQIVQPETASPQLAQSKPLQVEIILASNAPKAEETVDYPEEEAGNNKALFAKKVAKQLWNMKQGQKPNLQELGLASSYTIEAKAKNRTLTKTINL